MAWSLLPSAPSNPRMLSYADGCLVCVNMLPGGTTVSPGIYQYGDVAHPANGSGAAPSWKQIASALTPTGQGSQATYHVGAVRIRKYSSTLYCLIGNCQVNGGYPLIVGKSTDGGASWVFQGIGQTDNSLGAGLGGGGWVNDIDGPNGTPLPWYLLRDTSSHGMAPDGPAGNWTGIDQDPLDAQTCYAFGRSGGWKCSNVLDAFTGGTPVLYPVVRGIFGGENRDVLWDRRWNGYAYLGVSDWRFAGSSDGFKDDDKVWHSDPGSNDNVQAIGQNTATGKLYLGFANGGGASGALYSIANPAVSSAPAPSDWQKETTAGDALDDALASHPVNGICVMRDGSGAEVVLVAVAGDAIYRRAGGGSWARISAGPLGFKGNVTQFATVDDQTGRVAVFSPKVDGLWASSDYGVTWANTFHTSAGTTGAQGVCMAPDGTLYHVDTQHVRKTTNAWSGSPSTVNFDTGLSLSGSPAVDRTGPIAIKPDGSMLYMVNRSGSGAVGYLVQCPLTGGGAGTWVEPAGRSRHPDGLFQVLKMDCHQDGRLLFALDGQAVRRGMWPASSLSVDLGSAYGGGYNQSVACDPHTAGRVNAGADTGGSYYSADRAHSFQPTGHEVATSDDVATSDRNIVHIYPHPTVTGRWYKLTRVGHWQSDDGGQTWHDTMPSGVGPSINPSAGGGGHPRNVGQHACFLADGTHLVGAAAGKVWARANDDLIAAGVTSTPWVATPSPTTLDITGIAVDDDGATVYLSDGHQVWANSAVPAPTYHVAFDQAGKVLVTA